MLSIGAMTKIGGPTLTVRDSKRGQKRKIFRESGHDFPSCRKGGEGRGKSRLTATLRQKKGSGREKIEAVNRGVLQGYENTVVLAGRGGAE